MKIGQELKACYEVPQDLPPEMLALLMQLNDRREKSDEPAKRRGSARFEADTR